MAEELEPHILRKFQILQKLGKGAYGVVWKAIDKKTKKTIALKKVFDAFQNSTDAQRTFRQVIFLQQLKGHPHIVSLLGILKAENNKDIYLVFDFMETDLHAVVRANIMETVHKKYVLYQVLKGIKYMHSGELIHRDLKPSNILLDSDCLAKLADFGLARSISSANQSALETIMTEYVATRWYRAPQILLGSSKYTKAVDMWSIGCILAEMYTGKAIFPGNSTLNQIQKILELLGKPNKQQIESMESVMAKQCLNQISFVKKRSFSSFFQSMDDEAQNLVRNLLTFDPNLRLTVEEALEHPYLKQFHNRSEEICYKGVVKISIDESVKYSIREYREALYGQILKKKPVQKTLVDTKFSNYFQNPKILESQQLKYRQMKLQQQEIRKVEQTRQKRDSYNRREAGSKQNEYCRQPQSAFSRQKRTQKSFQPKIYHQKEYRYIERVGTANSNIGRRR